MPPIPFADNFLAGSLLSLLLPGFLVVVLGFWLHTVYARVPEETPTSSAALPSPEVVAAAPPEETGITPAGPPPAHTGITPAGPPPAQTEITPTEPPRREP
ncbi:MAG: hypothetical protein ACR2MK_00315 [Solirubrobacteraceae bacterium]